jgi:lysophospholipase L1-like esterase
MITAQTIFLGDSLIAFHDWNRLGEHRNAGIAGETTDGLLRRLHYTLERNPERIILLIGINDLLQRIPLQRIKQNYAQILERLGHVESVFVLSLLPVSAMEQEMVLNKEITELNSFVEAVARQEGRTYVDLHSHFADKRGAMQECYTTDGVHLTPEGYRLLESRLAPYLKGK